MRHPDIGRSLLPRRSQSPRPQPRSEHRPRNPRTAQQPPDTPLGAGLSRTPPDPEPDNRAGAVTEATWGEWPNARDPWYPGCMASSGSSYADVPSAGSRSSSGRSAAPAETAYGPRTVQPLVVGLVGQPVLPAGPPAGPTTARHVAPTPLPSCGAASRGVSASPVAARRRRRRAVRPRRLRAIAGPVGEASTSAPAGHRVRPVRPAARPDRRRHRA